MTFRIEVARSRIARKSCSISLRSWGGPLLVLTGALLVTVAQANALATQVVASNSSTCDPLGLGGGSAGASISVDELGTSAAFALADEGITAVSALTSQVACPTNSSISGVQVELSITNSTTRSFANLWYVADGPTTFSNIDGEVNQFSAFKIDGTVTVNANNPLIAESMTSNEIFEPGETWTFIIDHYDNFVGGPSSASSLGSIGVGSDSDQVLTIYLSSGSIISAIPEPNSALLLGLGLAALSSPRWRMPKRLAQVAGSARPRVPLSHKIETVVECVDT